MKRSTKVILWIVVIAVIHVLVAIFGYYYYVLFEFLLIVNAYAYAISILFKILYFLNLFLCFITIVASAPGLLWWLYRQVRQDVIIPNNALETGILGWLLAQCTISVLIAIAYIAPGQLVLVDKFLKAVEAPWWQVPLQLAVSFPVGLAVFHFRKALHRR